MPKFVFLLLAALSINVCLGQVNNAVPRLEPGECLFKADGDHKTRCGYLVVKENRSDNHSPVIRLPYIYVESENPNKKPDPVLFSGGGPGLSSLHPVTSIGRRSLLRDRDYIAFEQRGTHYAQPNLECDGVSLEIQAAYLHHQSTDGAELSAVAKCRQALKKKGISIASYNTDESAADIDDLRRLLKIDSLNLMGISYSGGLMMTVAERYPTHVRTLVLDSPLPEFIPIDEQELANFNEALTNVLDGDKRDLTARFRAYFSGLDGRNFVIQYKMRDGSTASLHYGRSEMLQILHGKMEDYDGIKEVPKVVSDMIAGKQEPYVKDYFDGVFSSRGSISGMRLSVYCSDKMAFANPAVILSQEAAMPWLKGFHVNDVYAEVCKVWSVPPVEASTKAPFYSQLPALLGAGGLDDSCRPIYNDEIHHFLPNSQRLLFPGRQHGPLLNSREGDVYIGQFLDDPTTRLVGQEGILAPDDTSHP